MASFDFVYPVARLVFGTGSLLRAEGELERLGRSRALVISGPNLFANEALVQRVRQSLGATYVGWFPGVEPYAPLAVIPKVVDAVDGARADVLVAIGGGSTMLTSQLAAAISGQNMSVLEYLEKYKVRGSGSKKVIPQVPAPRLDIMAIPTTLSGSEMDGTTSALMPDGERRRIRALSLSPKVVLYDPEVAATTPRRILAGTALNSLDHAVEGYYARGANPFIEAFALSAVRAFSSHLLAWAADPSDLDAIAGIQEGSALASASANSLLILEARGKGLNHALGHVLASNYGQQQGDAHAVVMPHGMRFVRDAVPERLGDLARAMGLAVEGMSPGGAADLAIGRVCEIRDALGLPSRLRTLLPDRALLDDVARRALADFSIQSTPRSVEYADLMTLLQGAW